MKFSKNFERDWEFYYSQRHHFTFSGIDIKSSFGVQFPNDPNIIEVLMNDEKEIPVYEDIVPYSFVYSATGKTAKECFYKLDSTGKYSACSEPELLVEILSCKSSINLQIQIWAQSRAEYTLPLIELEEYMDYFKCPAWVLKAIEHQKNNIIKQWTKENKYKERGFYLNALANHCGEMIC